MRKILIAVAAVFAVLVVVVIVVPLLVPTETWKGEIERRASDATGRKLTIAGPVRLSLFPAAAVVANDVSFANAPGAQEPMMATLGKLEVRVRVLPLLSGNIAIDRFVVDKPVIHLEVDRQGRSNWDFAAQQKPAAEREPERPQQPAAQGGGAPGAIELGDVRLTNGLITYADARSGARYEASDIDASLTLKNLDSPFKADGSLVWNKEKVSLKGEVAQPSAVMAGKSSNVGLTIDSKPMRFAFAGHATGGAASKLDGTVDLNVPSVRNLAAWLGQPLDVPGDALGPLAIKGTLAAEGKRASFTKATYTLDAIEASGDLSVDASGRVPYAKATLATNFLDLNPYMPAQKAGAGGGAPAASAPAGSPTPQPAASQGWSNEPIDASGLKAVNADLSLTVEGLKVRDINTGKSVLNVALKDGRLNADLPELALYGGNGKGRLTINGAERVPALSMTMNFSGIQAEPLLKDAMAFERLRGTGDADVTLDARGESQRALVSALNGKGSVKFHDGAVKGINLGAMMRNIGSAFLDAEAGKPQETDFAELSGTYTIANGILRNDDLALQSPLLRVAGKGTVDMPQRTVDYRVEPKVVATTQGQGAQQGAAGIAVPVVISGPWDKISYKPDLAGMLQSDPEGAVRGLRDLLRGQPSGGGQQQPAAPGGSQQQQQQPKPLDQLKGLLGR